MHQTLEVLAGPLAGMVLPVSTSVNGVGFEPGSLKTPTGLFRISDKIGDGLPCGSVFKSRIWTGEIWTPDTPGHRDGEDLILTRILWLDGLEPANANTRGRYIYFHGTNHESLVGMPASHGCIRLCNVDMLQLYWLARTDDKVLIEG